LARAAIWKPPKFKSALLGGGTQTAKLSPAVLAMLKGGARTTAVNTRGIMNAKQPQTSPGGGNPAAGILADYMNQMRADAAADRNAEKGSMIQNLRQAIISYGLAPDYSALGKDAQGYLKEALDPNTLALAAKNEAEGISSHARLGRANEQSMRRIPAALAARGILRSGQTGSDFGDQAQDFKNQGYDMVSALMQGIQGSVGGFQEAERARQRALAEAEMQAAMQASEDWSDSDFGDTGDTGDTGPASTSAKPGAWLAKRRAQLAAQRAAAARRKAASLAAQRANERRRAQAGRAT
jgi:hypothetical protein